MSKLVIITKKVHEVGQVCKGLKTGPHREPRPEQLFRIVAESTKKEWIDCIVSFGEDREWAETVTRINGPWYYYEIETD